MKTEGTTATLGRFLTLSVAICLVPGIAQSVPASANTTPETKQIKRAAKLSSQGDAAMQQGDFEGAGEKYDEALDELPGFALAEIGLGHIAMRTGEYAAALEHYEKAKVGYVQLGQAMLQVEAKRYANTQSQIQGLRDRLVDEMGRGTEPTPGSPATAQNLQASKIQNMIAQLEAVEAPRDTSATEPPAELDFYVGNALFRLGKLDEAIQSWEQCAEKNTEFAMVHNNLALGYWQKGELGRATASIERAGALGFPVNPRFQDDLAAAVNAE